LTLGGGFFSKFLKCFSPIFCQADFCYAKIWKPTKLLKQFTFFIDSFVFIAKPLFLKHNFDGTFGFEKRESVFTFKYD